MRLVVSGKENESVCKVGRIGDGDDDAGDTCVHCETYWRNSGFVSSVCVMILGVWTLLVVERLTLEWVTQTSSSWKTELLWSSHEVPHCKGCIFEKYSRVRSKIRKC